MYETAGCLKKNTDLILLWITRLSQVSGKPLDAHFRNLMGSVHPEIVGIKNGQQIIQKVEAHRNQVLTKLTDITNKRKDKEHSQ